jgi:hypothetical protein
MAAFGTEQVSFVPGVLAASMGPLFLDSASTRQKIPPAHPVFPKEEVVF